MLLNVLENKERKLLIGYVNKAIFRKVKIKMLEKDYISHLKEENEELSKKIRAQDKEIKTYGQKRFYNRPKIEKEIRSAVYKKYNGRCAYCGNVLNEHNYQIDHANPFIYSNDSSLNNLMPCCYSCNMFKNNLTIDEFRNKIMLAYDELYETIPKFRLIDKYGLISKKDNDVKFYFEKLNG